MIKTFILLNVQNSFNYVDFWGTVSDLLKQESGDQLPPQDDQQVSSILGYNTQASQYI
jgi:hypothetical protein